MANSKLFITFALKKVCFVREVEQGKPTVRMDKVNQVLALFSMELMPVQKERSEA